MELPEDSIKPALETLLIGDLSTLSINEEWIGKAKSTVYLTLSFTSLIHRINREHRR